VQRLSGCWTGRDERWWNLRGHRNSEAIADGNLVTAPAWPAHPAWLAKFLVVLGTKIEL